MINRLDLHIAKLEGEAEKEALESLWVCLWSLWGAFLFFWMYACIRVWMYPWSRCLFVVEPACLPSQLCLHPLQLYYNDLSFFPLNYRQKQVFVFSPCAGGIPSMSVWLHLSDSFLLLSIARNQGHPGCPPCCWGWRRQLEPSPGWSPGNRAANRGQPCSERAGCRPCWSSAVRARWRCGGTVLVLRWEINTEAEGEDKWSKSIRNHFLREECWHHFQVTLR